MAAWRWSYTLLYAYNLHFRSGILRKRFFDYLFSLVGMNDDGQVSEGAWLRAKHAGLPFQRPGSCMSCILCSPITPWAKNKAVDPTRVVQMAIHPIHSRTEQGEEATG